MKEVILMKNITVSSNKLFVPDFRSIPDFRPRPKSRSNFRTSVISKLIELPDSSLFAANRINRYNMVNRINKSENQGNVMPYEVRKVQDSMRCLMISIPKRFARWMNLEKGTHVRIHFDSDEHLGNRMIIERVTFREDEAEA